MPQNAKKPTITVPYDATAMAARRAKSEMSHGDVIERIVELAMAHPIRERSAI